MHILPEGLKMDENSDEVRVNGDRENTVTAMNVNSNSLNGGAKQEKIAILDAGAQYGKVRPTLKIVLFPNPSF